MTAATRRVPPVTLTLRDAELPLGGAAGEVVEVHLLVLREDLSGLERAAGAEGVTVARLLRRVIREYLARQSRSGATHRTNPATG